MPNNLFVCLFLLPVKDRSPKADRGFFLSEDHPNRLSHWTEAGIYYIYMLCRGPSSVRLGSGSFFEGKQETGFEVGGRFSMWFGLRLFGQLPKKSDGMIGMMIVFIALEDMIHTFQFWGSTGCSPNWVQKNSRDYDWYETTTDEWFFEDATEGVPRAVARVALDVPFTSPAPWIKSWEDAHLKRKQMWQLPFVQP